MSVRVDSAAPEAGRTDVVVPPTAAGGTVPAAGGGDAVGVLPEAKGAAGLSALPPHAADINAALVTRKFLRFIRGCIVSR